MHIRSRSKYQAVADAIRQLIAERDLGPGDRLPTEHETAHKLGVSYLTVRRANEDLIREGLIERKQGKGTFVAGKIPRPAGGLRVGYLGVGRELQGFALQMYTTLKDRLDSLGRPVQLVFDMVYPHTGHDLVPPQFRGGGVDAVVAYGVFDESLLRALARRIQRLLVVGNAVRVPGVPTIELDLDGLGYEMVRVLVRDLGYQDVWMVVEPLRLYSTVQLLAGYRRAVEDGLIGCELVSLLEEGSPLPLIKSFTRLAPLLGTRQAIVWFSSHPMVPLGLLGARPTPGDFGVVSYGAHRPGWSLPSEYDLGVIPFPWDLFGREITAWLAGLSDPRPGRGAMITPIVSAVRTPEGRGRLVVEWRAVPREPGESGPSGGEKDGLEAEGASSTCL